MLPSAIKAFQDDQILLLKIPSGDPEFRSVCDLHKRVSIEMHGPPGVKPMNLHRSVRGGRQVAKTIP
jgi:hypothetical protein